jgi:hypothetical protein
MIGEDHARERRAGRRPRTEIRSGAQTNVHAAAFSKSSLARQRALLRPRRRFRFQPAIIVPATRAAPGLWLRFLLKAREEGKTARRRRGVFSLKDTHSLSGLRGASRRAVGGVFRRPAALSSEVQALSRGASASSVSRLPAGVHSNPGRSPNAARVRGLRQPHPRAPLRPKARISRAPGHRGCGPHLRPAPRSVPPPRRLMKASPRRTRWGAVAQADPRYKQKIPTTSTAPPPHARPPQAPRPLPPCPGPAALQRGADPGPRFPSTVAVSAETNRAPASAAHRCGSACRAPFTLRRAREKSFGWRSCQT